MTELTRRFADARRLSRAAARVSISDSKAYWVGHRENMGVIAKLLRGFSKWRFRILGLATIKDIPTDKFNELVQQLIASGWKKTYEYAGFDAWIDYGRIKLRKDGSKLNLEWDNWTEGSVEGPRRIIETIAEDTGYPVMHEWRWSEYDGN